MKTKGTLWIMIGALIFLVSDDPIFAKVEPKEAIYYYTPSSTTLVGILRTRIYAGPPNYESVKQGDEAEKIWLVQLQRSVTVLDDKDPTSNNETEKNVREIQLVIQNEADGNRLKHVIGKPIKLTGTLFHAWSGHHHLNILMDVKSYEIRN